MTELKNLTDIALSIGVYGIPVLWAISVIKLFPKNDDSISPEAVKTIRSFLKEAKFPLIPRNTPIIFCELFDNVFGKKHFTLRCFLISSGLSLSLTCTFFLLSFFIIFPQDLGNNYFSIDLLIQSLGKHWQWLLLFNPIVDYFSLYQTRLIIGCFKESSGFKVIVLLTLDSIFTFTLYVFSAWYAYDILGDITSFDNFYWAPSTELMTGQDVFSYKYCTILGWWGNCIDYSNSFPYMFSSLVTTFFTSIWLWLFLFTMIAVKASKVISQFWKFGQWVLPIEKHVLKSIGIISGVITLILGYLILFVRYLIV